MFAGDPDFKFPSDNKVLLRFATPHAEHLMKFQTVAEAREYLAYRIEKGKQEADEAMMLGSFATPRVIEDSIAIYDDGKLVT
jgi:hypothetical protein